MQTSALPENVRTKVIVRQEDDYEAAGLDGRRTIPLPWDESCYNIERLQELGFHIPGVIRQHNQNFVENIGNSYGARVRKAVEKGETLPNEEDFDNLVASYDYSGIRASSETGMPLEERTFRTMLKKQLRNLLRNGIFSSDGSPLTVQTTKEASKEELPDGKMALEDFEVLVECAAEGAEFGYDGLSFDFSGDPEFDENGDFLNFAAVSAFARDLAEKEIALRRDAVGRSIKPSMPKD